MRDHTPEYIKDKDVMIKILHVITEFNEKTEDSRELANSNTQANELIPNVIRTWVGYPLRG